MAYTVVKGDTLNKIAAANGMTLAELLKLNPQFAENPDLILPGQTVNLSSGEAAGGGGDDGDTSVDAGGGVTVDKGKPKAEGKAGEGVGVGGDDPDTQLTILTAEEMDWFFDKATGKWYVKYGLPNSGKSMVFEATPDQMDALFGKGYRPTSYKNKSFADIVANNNTFFSGNIAEMEGTGSFEAEIEKVITLALDNGALPTWMEGSDKALDILFISVSENKSNEWVMEQWSKLPEFKARFPGIKKLMDSGNLTLTEAVTGFLEYEAGINQAVAALGMDPEAVTPKVVSALMQKGWSLQGAQTALSVYDRMDKFAPAMAAFNSILELNGMDTLDDEDAMFDFLAGNAPQEFYDIYEASSLAEAATAAGLGDLFDAQDAVDAALEGDFDLQNATEGMKMAAQLLLRLRSEIDVNAYGLSHEELIDLSLGLTPEGRTEAEIQDAVNRATLSAKGNLQKKSQPFASFDQDGRIKKQSLGALRQQF